MEITSIFIKAATGVVTGISRLWNKRLFQELKWKLKLMITCKRKRKNNYIQKESLESFCESQSIENFEDISKESLTQLLIMIYLRFSLDAQTIQVEHEGDYDEYIFSKKNFQTLSQELGLHSIYESYIPCLCLIEYFPSLFEEIRQDLKFQSNFFRSFTLQENLAKLVRIKQNHKNFQEFPVFFTSDKKFVIKSINSSERNFFLNHLEQYKNKIKKNSFLVRIVALFRVEHVKAEFIIMENTVRKAGKALRFQINDWNEIRETSFELHCPRYGKLFDYSELVNSRLKINIGSSQCFEIIRKIEDDLKFLNSFKATGYSIMVCFYQPGIKVDSRYVVEGVFENYEISIIGIWKEFGFWRRIEMIFKKMIKKNQDYLNVDPKEYSERLLKIFSDLINDVGV